MSNLDKFEWKAHFKDPNVKPDEIKLKCSYITSDEKPAGEVEGASKSARPAADEGVRQRPSAKAAPVPAAKTATKTESKSPTKVAAASPPAVAPGPGYTVFLIVALL